MPNQPPGVLPKNFKRWQPVWGTPIIDPVNQAIITEAAKKTSLAIAFYGHSATPPIGSVTINDQIFDFWAEFWGKRGVEGVGPWGPHGPSGPWGPKLAQGLAMLSERDQEAFKGLVEKIANKIK